MFAYIRGKIEDITENAVIIEANGVGYELICPNPFQFHGVTDTVKIFTYHHVREDAQLLYGFKTVEEKELFTKILGVSGVGPKGALAVLASTTVEDFAIAIEHEDEKFLTTFPGVGKKTARQMILDLKGKLTFDIRTDVTDKNPSTISNSKALEEALEALKALGYSDSEIRQIKPELKKLEVLETDGYIRKGLALLMK
ncbi:Holliday junction DNA helicase RuvA [Gracilibacillus halotolerans]|uniref:Holliday junction branch migration complex subunit RuvA n=1 Tax=Gracilibacillus halotolerans TaxID=74386 RepID=A0A841RJV9_9BACI|nr:Holliday junction branch migration protein RuvA [Gracilibacillus halotolerans]MBB6511923.1 Holliday junction DNA helicase RuvA [Gracilibacillus halotolerans]